MSIQELNLIKEYILEFIKSKLIVKVNSYIPIEYLTKKLLQFLVDKDININENINISDLNLYPNLNLNLYQIIDLDLDLDQDRDRDQIDEIDRNIDLNIYPIIISLLSQHFEFQHYKSIFFNKEFVCFHIDWKPKDPFTTLDTIKLKNEVIDLIVELNNLKVKANEIMDLELNKVQNLKKKDKILAIKKIKNTLDIGIENILERFIDTFLEYSKDSNKLLYFPKLYLQDILDDFKTYIGLNICNFKFAKDFKKIIFIKYPEIKIKLYKNRTYYKGLLYKIDLYIVNIFNIYV
jgi:hypothetical protein